MLRNIARQQPNLFARFLEEILWKLLVRKVDCGLGQCGDADQLLSPALVQAGQATGRLVESLVSLRRGLGIDQIGDGFGLGEIEAPVLDRAAREFPPLCSPKT